MNKLFLRKAQFQAPRINIYGAPLSGKSSLAKMLLPEAKIINLADIRSTFAPQKSALESADGVGSIADNNTANTLAQELIITHASEKNLEFLRRFSPPKRCIITSLLPLRLDGFCPLRLDYLDYEEFRSIYKGANALGDFLLRGRMPLAALASVDAFSLQQMLSARLGAALLAVLATLSDFIATESSLAQMYRAHSARFKMGKNEFYAAISQLEELNLIFFLRLESKKRLFFSDFGMKNALSFNKNFSATFANVIACELIALYEDLRAHSWLDFYSPSAQLGVRADAFLDAEFARLGFRRLAKAAKQLGLKTVLFLSLNVSFNEQIAGINFIALPLENYLLSKDEALI